MFESFVIMLREGIEASLIVAITLVVVRRTQRRDLERAVYWGLSLAVLASVVVAVVLNAFSMTSDAYEGILYWVAAVFVVSMLFWMHRKAGTLKAGIEQRVTRAAASSSGGTRKETIALGVFAFLMVFREGAEAVLFLSAVRLTTSALLSFAGSLLGLAAAVIFAALFVGGGLRVNLKRFFAVTEWVMGLFLVQLLINGYHELAESGYMPANRESMAWVGPIVKNDSLFILALVAIPLFVWLSRPDHRPTEAAGESDAERRLALASVRRDRAFRVSATLATLAILGVVGTVYARELHPKTLPPPAPVIAQGGMVLIPVQSLQDGHLHYFSYPVADRNVIFLAMKLPNGFVRTALNACKICGPIGYAQDGPNLVCLNCDAEINPTTLGDPGGCNPIPLPSKVAGGNVEIPVSELVASAPVFKEAKGPIYVDPVCGMRLLPGQVGATITYNGKVYHFCKMPSCRALFEKDPTKYAH